MAAIYCGGPEVATGLREGWRDLQRKSKKGARHGRRPLQLPTIDLSRAIVGTDYSGLRKTAEKTFLRQTAKS
jgi:hypothetical protein